MTNMIEVLELLKSMTHATLTLPSGITLEYDGYRVTLSGRTEAVEELFAGGTDGPVPGGVPHGHDQENPWMMKTDALATVLGVTAQNFRDYLTKCTGTPCPDTIDIRTVRDCWQNHLENKSIPDCPDNVADCLQACIKEIDEYCHRKGITIPMPDQPDVP